MLAQVSKIAQVMGGAYFWGIINNKQTSKTNKMATLKTTTQKQNSGYTLTRTLTNRKGAAFLYTITEDASGNIISHRQSAREYVAATIDGRFYFGRLDLIGKGDHGKNIMARAQRNIAQQPIAYLNAGEIVSVEINQAPAAIVLVTMPSMDALATPQTKATGGKWEAFGTQVVTTEPSDDDKADVMHSIADTKATNIVNKAQAHANAQLMAAAPELLHALKMVLGQIIDNDIPKDKTVLAVAISNGLRAIHNATK